MGLLNIIRRMALREKLPLREIARRTGMSRNTIKKYLNAGTIEPQFATPERQSKLEPFSEKLAGWLKTESAKSRKQRRTLKQMHVDQYPSKGWCSVAPAGSGRESGACTTVELVQHIEGHALQPPRRSGRAVDADIQYRRHVHFSREAKECLVMAKAKEGIDRLDGHRCLLFTPCHQLDEQIGRTIAGHNRDMPFILNRDANRLGCSASHPLRADKRETIEWLKFTLEGVGE